MPSMAAMSKRGMTNSRAVSASPLAASVARPPREADRDAGGERGDDAEEGIEQARDQEDREQRQHERRAAAASRRRPRRRSGRSRRRAWRRRSASGCARSARPSGRKAAVSIISMAATRKAPTAAARSKPLVAAISAAPGVDQAQMIGMRWRQDSQMLGSALGDREPRDPGHGLGRRRADRLRRGQDDGDGGGEADEDRDQRGEDDRHGGSCDGRARERAAGRASFNQKSPRSRKGQAISRHAARACHGPVKAGA